MFVVTKKLPKTGKQFVVIRKNNLNKIKMIEKLYRGRITLNSCLDGPNKTTE